MTLTRFGKSIKTFKGIKKACSKISKIFVQKRRRVVRIPHGIARSVSLVEKTKKNAFCLFYSLLAQLVEQLTLNQWVEGSSPSGVTRKSVNELLTSKLTDFCFL